MFTDVKEFRDLNYIDDQEQRAIEAVSKGDVTVSGSIAREALRRGLLSEIMADKLLARRKSVSERIERFQSCIENCTCSANV